MSFSLSTISADRSATAPRIITKAIARIRTGISGSVTKTQIPHAEAKTIAIIMSAAPVMAVDDILIIV